MGYDFKQIAEGARAFHHVGRIYLEPEKKAPGVAAIPYYVDTAFACELYMKAIIAFQNPNITIQEFRQVGHRLNKLFEALPTNTQKKIRDKIPDDEIKKMEASHISQYEKLLSTDAPTTVKNIAKIQIENSVSSFKEMLEQQASLFEDWRYYYEANDDAPISCKEWFLYKFCTELHNCVVEIMN